LTKNILTFIMGKKNGERMEEKHVLTLCGGSAELPARQLTKEVERNGRK